MEKDELSFGKKLIICQSREDYIFYAKNIFKEEKPQIKKGTYSSGMTYKNIINIDSNYFSDYNGEIITLKKNEINLLYFNYKDLQFYHIFINPINIADTIEIKDYSTNILYLKKSKTYKLKFDKNKINRMIYLSRATINSQISITQKKITLNSNNLYYQIEDNYKGELNLVVSKENALIEFHFKQNDFAELAFDRLKFSLVKQYNILRIPKKYSDKIIKIYLKSQTNIIANIYTGYSKPPYTSYFHNEEGINYNSKTYTIKIIKPYKDDIVLMDKEYYSIFIEKKDNDLNLEINIQTLDDWEIALIVINIIF